MIYLALMPEDVEYLHNRANRKIVQLQNEVQRHYAEAASRRIEPDAEYLQAIDLRMQRMCRIGDMCRASLIAKAPAEVNNTAENKQA